MDILDVQYDLSRLTLDCDFSPEGDWAYWALSAVRARTQYEHRPSAKALAEYTYCRERARAARRTVLSGRLALPLETGVWA